MKKVCVLCFPIMLFLVMTSSARAADWRFPVGLSLISGMQDITDLYESNLKAENPYADVQSADSIPMGISFTPYIQTDFGLGLGGMVGPVMMIIGDASFFNLPVGVDARYIFIPDASMSPYVRAGFKYNLAGGDYVESSTPGLLAGVGLEFMRTRRVGFGFELAYDTSEIEFEDVAHRNTTKIKPVALTLSGFAIF